jgi:enamine deaminase RidA (YjgF/YER057c/UK114 family)
MEDAVRATVYVVATEQTSLGKVWRELLGSEVGAALRTPATLVGVEQLGYDGRLVEIERTAAVPLA